MRPGNREHLHLGMQIFCKQSLASGKRQALMVRCSPSVLLETEPEALAHRYAMGLYSSLIYESQLIFYLHGTLRNQLIVEGNNSVVQGWVKQNPRMPIVIKKALHLLPDSR